VESVSESASDHSRKAPSLRTPRPWEAFSCPQGRSPLPLTLPGALRRIIPLVCVCV